FCAARVAARRSARHRSRAVNTLATKPTWGTFNFVYEAARAPAREQGPLSFASAQASSAIAPFVEEIWAMAWDIPGDGVVDSLVVPSAGINLILFPTPKGVFGRVTGVRREALPYRLCGRGRILGVRFRPGGFYPFYGKPVSAFTGASIELGTWLGDDERTLTA